jgi:NADP-dependent 3-hydroxy acid dehydrogenase YdfG
MPDSRTMIITGASSGIGAATARAASEQGWNLVLAARSTDRIEALAGQLGEAKTAAVTCDVTEWDSVEALAAATLDRFGSIDAVFANAGFGGPGGFTGSTPERWREMVLTNVYGAALTVRATVDHLRESKGHLLLTGSVAGRKAMPGSLYSCTKWAVTAMGEAVRAEIAGSGVRVTLIEPGIVATPFWDDGKGPLDTPLTDVDIANAVMWALGQPAHVDVNEILIRPAAQGV